MRGAVLPAVRSPNSRGSLAYCPAMILPAPITSPSALHLGLTRGIDNVAFKAEPDQPHSFGTGGKQNSQLSPREELLHFLHYTKMWPGLGPVRPGKSRNGGCTIRGNGGGAMYWPCKELGARVMSVPIRASDCGKVCLASGQVVM